MTSKNIYSTLSESGTMLQLRHGETSHVIEELPLIKALPEHKAYIISTWVKSYATFNRKLRTVLNGAASIVRSEDFTIGEAQIAETLWEKTYVVSGKEDTFTINAWVCGEEGRLYNAYVPPALRRMGIFTTVAHKAAGPGPVHTRLMWPYKKVESLWMSYNPYCWLPQVRELAQQSQ